MATTARKWLVGCGIGCGLIIVILGGMGTCAYFGVRKVVDRADHIESGFEALKTQYGEVSDYCPPPGGALAPDRLEVFLAVRDDQALGRREVSDLFATLDGKGPSGVVAKVKAGLRFIPAMLEFIAGRNEALLERGMGLGEYQHIYCLAYFSYLDKDPADGPGFTVTSDDDGQEERGFRWHSSEDEEEVRYKREKEVRKFVNRVQGRMLANQLEALEGEGDGQEQGSLWADQLAAEVRAMKAERLRLPWEEGLPEVIRVSLEPFRDRLEASYDPMTTVLEVGMVEND